MTDRDPRLAAFLARAFGRARAADANRQIEQVRRDEGDSNSYEIVVGAEESFAQFAERLVPRLVYHLESKKARLPECHGVFLSVFSGEELYFVRARDAILFFAEALGTTASDLADRYGTRRK